MKADPANTPVFDLPVARIWMDTSRVVHIVFKPDCPHGIEEARQVVKAYSEMTEGAACPVLADITSVTGGANRSAREFYVSPLDRESTAPMAMVTKSPMQRMLGNFFARLNRPPYPFRVFNDTESALSWIAQLQK